ncbi:hypothetical protein VP01_120g1 [Puccinia sorghi]|uniref:Uncharacterized protein n=1 Tax=Puccinia sorghi TaxID=27349 RepID=A0A0L6VRS7_9BASI|nr:hypothetical protein VP01_120g1 [Puccinia sorghi]
MSSAAATAETRSYCLAYISSTPVFFSLILHRSSIGICHISQHLGFGQARLGSPTGNKPKPAWQCAKRDLAYSQNCAFLHLHICWFQTQPKLKPPNIIMKLSLCSGNQHEAEDWDRSYIKLPIYFFHLSRNNHPPAIPLPKPQNTPPTNQNNLLMHIKWTPEMFITVLCKFRTRKFPELLKFVGTCRCHYLNFFLTNESKSSFSLSTINNIIDKMKKTSKKGFNQIFVVFWSMWKSWKRLKTSKIALVWTILAFWKSHERGSGGKFGDPDEIFEIIKRFSQGNGYRRSEKDKKKISKYDWYDIFFYSHSTFSLFFSYLIGSADQNQQKHNPLKNPKFTHLIGCPFSYQKEKGVWKLMKNKYWPAKALSLYGLLIGQSP